MRVFISADMEGIATTTDWEETQKGTVDYPGFEKIGSHTIRIETDNLTDILRAITFVL